MNLLKAGFIFALTVIAIADLEKRSGFEIIDTERLCTYNINIAYQDLYNVPYLVANKTALGFNCSGSSITALDRIPKTQFYLWEVCLTYQIDIENLACSFNLTINLPNGTVDYPFTVLLGKKDSGYNVNVYPSYVKKLRTLENHIATQNDWSKCFSSIYQEEKHHRESVRVTMYNPNSTEFNLSDFDFTMFIFEKDGQKILYRVNTTMLAGTDLGVSFDQIDFYNLLGRNTFWYVTMILFNSRGVLVQGSRAFVPLPQAKHHIPSIGIYILCGVSLLLNLILITVICIKKFGQKQTRQQPQPYPPPNVAYGSPVYQPNVINGENVPYQPFVNAQVVQIQPPQLLTYNTINN
eukprot:TRINITY_DN1479_c0_g1_i5.p1 TRINITY_DN1479_c0_g1~~TRINITY_DN1479_c0_g1_i5.p1  ORF type:complete len:351 (-),score=46.20 TRINITY_DN1479_c0_g1_i5:84-1136(-)